LQTELKYIELKTGFSDNGPAWIGSVSFSKSGKTIYFNGKAFQSLRGSGISGNYFEVETGDEYWISGVKKDMKDRHKHGGGKVLIDKNIVNEYLHIIGESSLPKTKYSIVDVDYTIPIVDFND